MQNKLLQRKLTHVENGPIAKLFRTIGYLALLVVAIVGIGSMLIAFTLFVNVEFLFNVGSEIIKFQTTNLAFLTDYIGLIFTGGILLLIWTQSKKLFLPIFTTVLILISVYFRDTFYAAIFGNGQIIPFLTLPQIDFVTDLLLEHNFLYGGTLVLTTLFVYIILGIKKPKRVSSSTVSSSMLILVFYLVLQFLPALLENDWGSNDIYLAITFGVGTLAFIGVTLGSVFGILGFARK